jgi:hypothetical protein
MDASDAKRLRALETENTLLKKLLAEVALDNEALEGGFRRKALSPPAKRRAVGKMLEATGISERRAYVLVDLGRDSWRHPPLRAQLDQGLSERIAALAQRAATVWVR